MSKTIYLISILSNIDLIALVLGVTSAILFTSLGGPLYYFVIPEEKELIVKFMKITGVISLIALIITTLIPDKEEMYAMIILKDYEPNQIYEMTKEELKEGIDYLFEKLNGEVE